MIHCQIITTKRGVDQRPVCLDNNIYTENGKRVTVGNDVFAYTELFLRGKDIGSLPTHIPVEHQGEKLLIQIIDSEVQDEMS